MTTEPIENPAERIRFWDYTFESPSLEPMTGSVLACGCYVRTPDYEAVLCKAHLDELNAEASL